jgi:hypothetical protein
MATGNRKLNFGAFFSSKQYPPLIPSLVVNLALSTLPFWVLSIREPKQKGRQEVVGYVDKLAVILCVSHSATVTATAIN